MAKATIISVEAHTDVGVFMPHTVSGAIVVDGVVATELTDFIPSPLASLRMYRALVRAVRAILPLVPAGYEQKVMNGLSQWKHGERDVFGSRDALLAPAASPSVF